MVAVAEVFAKPRLMKAGVLIGLGAPVFVFTRPLATFSFMHRKKLSMEHADKSDEYVSTEDIVDEEFKPSEEETNCVKREVARMRESVSGLSLDDLKSGDWFAKLLAFSMNQYVTQVDADYFKEKYPNLPPNAVVDARIKMAAQTMQPSRVH